MSRNHSRVVTSRRNQGTKIVNKVSCTVREGTQSRATLNC